MYMKKKPYCPYEAPKTEIRRLGSRMALCVSTPVVTLNQGESFSEEENNGEFQW